MYYNLFKFKGSIMNLKAMTTFQTYTLTKLSNIKSEEQLTAYENFVALAIKERRAELASNTDDVNADETTAATAGFTHANDEPSESVDLEDRT